MSRPFSPSLILAASLALAAGTAMAQSPGGKGPSPFPGKGGGSVPAGSRVKDECDQGINICNLRSRLDTEAGKRACIAAGGLVLESGLRTVCRKKPKAERDAIPR